MALAVLPDDLAARITPLVGAAERRLAVEGPLGALVPGGGVQRGATVVVDGVAGAGITSVTFSLAAAATAAGEWAAILDPYGTIGARAAAACGVELERCAVIRRVPFERWSTVVAALLDGVALVAAAVPVRLRTSDARRLSARARERAAVLVAIGTWPAEAALRVHVAASAWNGLAEDSGRLAARELYVRVDGRGAPRQGVVAAHAG
jgi:hypothetical protein